MKGKLIAGLIVSFILSGGSVLLAHERTWPAKRLKHIYPEATKFTSKQVTLNTSQIARIQKYEGIKIGVEDKSPTFYFAYRKQKIKKEKKITHKKKTQGKLMSIIIFIDEYGKNGRMEISVGMTPEGKIGQIDVWQHKEDKRVAKKEFLEQFKGKGVDFDFHPGHTITLIKKAEKASAAVMRAAQKSLLIMNEVYGKKEKKEHKHKKGETEEHHEEGDEEKEHKHKKGETEEHHGEGGEEKEHKHKKGETEKHHEEK